MTQLAQLAKPIDQRYVEQLPGKANADFVSHGIVEQYLIGILRMVPIQEIRRELYDGEILTGCVLRLTVKIDGEWTYVEEVGAGSNPTDKTNGDRLKSSVSDAYKRCAMRLSSGLALWCDHYFLDKVLEREPSLTRHQEDPGGDRGGHPTTVPSPSGRSSEPAGASAVLKAQMLAREAGIETVPELVAKAVEWGALDEGEFLSVLEATERLPSLAKLTANLKRLIADNKAQKKA